jgi:hypothetical protein
MKRPAGIGADRGGQRDAQPEPGRGHRGDGRRTPDDQRDAVDQLLLLTEGRGDVVARHQHVRVAVAQDDQVIP